MPGNGHEMTIQAQNRSRRIITLGVGLLALIAVALLLVDQLQQTSATGGRAGDAADSDRPARRLHRKHVHA